MTGHGFRSMASTLLNEQGWRKDAIERQLAHAERNAVRAAYNHDEKNRVSSAALHRPPQGAGRGGGVQGHVGSLALDPPR